MADAMEPVRHGVEQEPPHELVGCQRHHLGLTFSPVVLPGEAHLAIGEPDQPAVGEGNAVRVAAEIGEHLLRTCERTLGVDDPFDAAQVGETAGEGSRVRQSREHTGEAQFASRERRL